MTITLTDIAVWEGAFYAAKFVVFIGNPLETLASDAYRTERIWNLERRRDDKRTVAETRELNALREEQDRKRESYRSLARFTFLPTPLDVLDLGYRSYKGIQIYLRFRKDRCVEDLGSRV